MSGRVARKQGEGWSLTPKGCLTLAIDKVMGLGTVSDDEKDLIWLAFEDSMRRAGYVRNCDGCGKSGKRSNPRKGEKGKP